MKKLIALLISLAIAASLCACGNSTNGGTETKDTGSGSSVSDASDPDTSNEETGSQQPEDPQEPAGMESGDTGDGPADLDAGLITFTLPEGYSYEVDSLYIDDDDPLAGNLCIYLTATDASTTIPIMQVNASTMDMVASQDEAVQKTIELCNLQTYKEGKSAVGDDVTYGDNTYTRVDVSTEYSNDTYYVTYANTGNSYGTGLKVCILVDNQMIEADDPLINAVLESLEVVTK